MCDLYIYIYSIVENVTMALIEFLTKVRLKYNQLQ